MFQYQVTDLIQHWDGEGEYTQQVYRKVDKHLEHLLSHLPDNTTLFIASDHGGRGFKFLVNLNVWLDQMRLLAKDREGNIDYKHSIAFHMYWGIFINKEELKQRASVIPGFDPPQDKPLYDAFIDFLIQEAQSLNFPGTDMPIPLRLIRSPEDRLEPAPDIVVQAEYSNYMVHHEDFYYPGQELITTPLQIGKKYNHRRNGLFLAVGPGIKKGYKSSIKEIFDITPTVLYLLHLPVAEYFDGSIMEEIMEEAYLASHARSTIHAYHVALPEQAEQDYEREALEEKLRAIGYIK
ncbi:MAG: alkaline phosphatase family protein [Promethearchaeota archaeon]